jgi:pantetheine-phosphate adenylyltransferase
MKQSIAIYPGSFDPITLGHEDLIRRALGLFDRVIVAIGENEAKNPLFSVDERIQLIQQVFPEEKRLEVCSFNCLLVDFAKKKKTNIIIRGIRAISDFDFEFQMAGMNRMLSPSLETIFLMPADKYTFVSSSLVRVIAGKKGDVSKFVSPVVKKAIEDATT